MNNQTVSNLDIEKIRNQVLLLLEETQRNTLSGLSSIDPDRVVYTDGPIWYVRDVVGHLGVWNGEAACSIRVHAEGSAYHCIESEAEYDAYNRVAIEKRRSWNMNQVWAEYQDSFTQLKLLVETMPAEKWLGDMLYPWNERGMLKKLIEVMMKHEVEHREIILVA